MNLKIHQSTVNMTCLKMRNNASNNKSPEASKIRVSHELQ